MLLVGDDSPHDEEAMDMNGRMDPEKTDFVKVIADIEESLCVLSPTKEGLVGILFLLMFR